MSNAKIHFPFVFLFFFFAQSASCGYMRTLSLLLKCLLSMYRSSHRNGFSKYLFFFSRSNLFTIFQVCRTDMVFSREGLYFFRLRTDTNFPGGCITNRLYYLIEQVFSQKPVFSPRTHFQGASIYRYIIEQILIF